MSRRVGLLLLAVIARCFALSTGEWRSAVAKRGVGSSTELRGSCVCPGGPGEYLPNASLSWNPPYECEETFDYEQIVNQMHTCANMTDQLRVAGLLAPSVTSCCSSSARVNVSVSLMDPGQAPPRPVSRLIFGSNLEWANGGNNLLEPGSLRLDTLQLPLIQGLGFSLFRYPGGSLAETYDWSMGKSADLASRGESVNAYNGEKELVRFGTREMLELLERLEDPAGGVPLPLFQINLYMGCDHAADWLQWTNTERIVSRRTNQTLQKVIYWEMGNEPYLNVPAGVTPFATPEDYADRVAECVSKMRAVDPEIKIGVPLHGETQSSFTQFESRVLARLAEKSSDAVGGLQIDWFSSHNAYAPLVVDDSVSLDDRYLALMAATGWIRNDTESLRQTIKSKAPMFADVPFGMTEYNTLMTLHVPFQPADAQSASHAASLYVADALNMMAADPSYALANYWTTSSDWFFGAFEQNLRTYPSYPVLQAYSQVLQGKYLGVNSTIMPTFSNPQINAVMGAARDDTPVLSYLFTVQAEDQPGTGCAIRAMLLNKSPSDMADVTLDGLPKSYSGGWTRSLTGDPWSFMPDLYHPDNYTSPQWSSPTPLTNETGPLHVLLQPHSLSYMTLFVADSNDAFCA